MPAISAANTGEAFVQIAAGEKGRDGSLDDRPPEAVLGLKPLVVDPPEGLEMLIHQAPQAGGPRIAWTVESQRLDTRGHHDGNGDDSGKVY